MLRVSFLKQCVLVGLLVSAVGCVGGQPRLNDHGDLFAPGTQKEALKKLESINHEYHTYVVIDTFKKVPFYKDVLGKLPKMDEEKRAEFFKNWARKRVPGSSSIYLLLYTGAPEKHVEVAVGRDLSKAFPPSDRQELARIVGDSLRSEEAGPGLLAGIQFVQQRLNTNLGGPVTPRPFDWFSFGIIVLALAGTWLALVLLQIVSTGNQRAMFAGINLAGYGLAGGYLSLLGALRTARRRVEAVPPPPPPAFEDKPYPDEPAPVSDEPSPPRQEDAEAAASSLHDEHSSGLDDPGASPAPERREESQ